MSGVHNEIVTKTSKQSQANLAGDRTDLKHFGGGARARPFPGDTGLLLGGEGLERLRAGGRVRLGFSVSGVRLQI
jgi:hypothetical protein